jgi:hypothetical protein
MSVGLMPGIAAHVVRARANGWIVSAEWIKISGWWQGTGADHWLSKQPEV